jgi:hypothetical protein
MAKQVIKGMAMLVMLATLVLVSAAASNAQTRSKLHANVPFDFTVGDKNLNAGEYNIAGLFNSGDTIVVSNGDKAAIRLSTALTSSQPQNNNKLVFHRYGDRYFLAEVWRVGETTGRKLVSSKAEDAMRRELATVYRMRGIKKDIYDRVELLAVATRD